MKSTIVLIANPAAKRASEGGIRRAVDLLRSAGDVNVFLTKKRGDAEEIARNASRDGASIVVAAGGDGTFNEVINGMAHTDVPMAILPMGTTNVLAKELGILEDVDGAVTAALKGKTHSVSLGKITVNFPPATRYFCLMAGIGFDGEAVYGFDTSMKRYSKKSAYIISGLKTLLRYSPEPLRFIVDGETCEGYSAIVGKASKYGGNFKATPDASILRRELYICIMRGKRRSDILRYAWGIMTGRHLGFKDIVYRRASSVEIRGNARAQIDGDYLGRTPAVITVVSNALKLVY